LGIAHIGVLKYFEENRIPIDFIAGTSMGGLVGGFYATGLNAHDLEGLANDVDWDAVLSPNSRFSDEPMVEKQDWNRSAGNLVLRFGKRFSLPAGINSGQALILMLSRHTAAYGDIQSFDELPTPFRCVATDVVNAETVVLGSGSLAKALRATMAIPGVFTPVQWDDKFLIDGGVLDNLPVEVVRQMGADKVIAVTLEAAKPTRSEYNSLGGILRRTVSTVVLENERRSISQSNLLVRVQTSGLSGSDYAKAEELVARGYQAAQANAKSLAEFQLSREQWDAYVKRRRARVRPAVDVGPIVAVVSSQKAIQENAERDLHRKLGYGPVRQKQLEAVLSGLVAATGLPGAYYSWQGASDKPAGYRIIFLERGGPILLVRPSLFADLSSSQPVRVALKWGATVVPPDTYKSRFVSDVDIGSDSGIRVEYYHPFDGKAYFVAPGFIVQRFQDSEYQGATWLGGVRDRFAGSLYAGLGTWRRMQVRWGVLGGYDSYTLPLSSDGVVARSGPFLNPETTWLYNSQDSGGLPSRGVRVEGSLGYSYRNISFPYFKNEFSAFHPANRHVVLFGTSQLASTFGKKPDFYNQFPFGGEGELDAYRYQQFHVNALASARGGVILHGPGLESLSIIPGLAVWYEAARLDLGGLDWQTHQSTSLGVFIPTPVGAAGFSVGFDENGRARFRFLLGSF
jgi:NTE family protein